MWKKSQKEQTMYEERSVICVFENPDILNREERVAKDVAADDKA